MSTLSSRERVLAALRYQVPDHVPLLFHSCGFRPPPHLALTNPYEEAQRWLSLGVDAMLAVGVPLVYHPDVQVRSWEEHPPGERYPLLVKEYATPAGTLRQEVYRTEDWVSDQWPGHRDHPDELRLVDDYNVPRSRKFAVGDREVDVGSTQTGIPQSPVVGRV